MIKTRDGLPDYRERESVFPLIWINEKGFDETEEKLK